MHVGDSGNEVANIVDCVQCVPILATHGLLKIERLTPSKGIKTDYQALLCFGPLPKYLSTSPLYNKESCSVYADKRSIRFYSIMNLRTNRFFVVRGNAPLFSGMPLFSRLCYTLRGFREGLAAFSLVEEVV